MTLLPEDSCIEQTPRYVPVIHLHVVNPHSLHINESPIMYDRVSPPETFLTNYVSSCSHPVQTSFDSHHLVIIIYLIPITSRVRISIVTMHILFLSTDVFFPENTMPTHHIQFISYIINFHSSIHSLSISISTISIKLHYFI